MGDSWYDPVGEFKRPPSHQRQRYSYEDMYDAEMLAAESVRTSAVKLIHAAISAMGVLAALETQVAQEVRQELHDGLIEVGAKIP